jgi:hypothetical protein
MGVASSLLFQRVRRPRTAVWISLVALLIVLSLLAFVELLGLMSRDLSPVSDPVLVGPFRWLDPSGVA